MKTAEEIARQTLKDTFSFPVKPDGAALRGLMIRAIEADRAQHDLSYAHSIIDRHDARAVIWSREDAEGVLDELIDEDETAYPGPDEYRAIIDRAMQSYYWRSLSDCTEGDWDAIREAVREGIDA